MADILNGLMGHWKFDLYNTNYVANTAFDSSGRGNIGTLVGSPVSGVGQIGQAIVLDGTNNYVSVADSATIKDLAVGNSVTIACWAKRNGNNGWKPLLCKTNDTVNSSTRNYEFTFAGVGLGTSQQDSIMFVYHNVGGWVSFSSPGAYTDTNWHHYVFVGTIGTANTAKLYVDKSDVSGTWTTGAGTETPDGTTNGHLYIGQTTQTGERFPGSIDDVRIYNRILAQADITALYNYSGSNGILL